MMTFLMIDAGPFSLPCGVAFTRTAERSFRNEWPEPKSPENECQSRCQQHHSV